MSKHTLAAEYDYIIIGAGSAGCILANELSADGSNNVLLIEAGPRDNKLLIHMPAGVYSVYHDPAINWNYQSSPEPALGKRAVTLPRGKVVGGSSSINSMVYMRGHPYDYDRWAKKAGLSHWDRRHCLPYFKACERSQRGASAWHGSQGRLGVSQAKLDNPLYDAFLEAGRQAGQGSTDDPNGFQPEGVARLDSTTYAGRRCSAAVAHLKPALSRNNLTLIHGALVQRVALQGSTATAVHCYWQGEQREIHALNEIIVSAGAINTPKLLMLSGIGPRKHLEALDITCQRHLPGVGENLQDHPQISVVYASKKPVTLHKLTNPWQKLRHGCQWLFTRKGVVASNIWEAGGCIRSTEDVEHADLQYHFAPIHSELQAGNIKLFQGYTTQIDLLRPRSRGHIKLADANPSSAPVVTFNYLKHPLDVKDMLAGIAKARELLQQPAFDEFRGEELAPGTKVTNKNDLTDYLLKNVSTDYHPSCSCAMGQDDMSVVDAHGMVHGMNNLRVVDASIMPDIVSGNLNAPTQMIALKLADVILQRTSLQPEDAPYAFKIPES